MNKTTNMTEGNPWKLIFLFSIPLMLGNMCQQLYTVADAAVVGQGLGVLALAAIGDCDWFLWTMLGLLMGFSQGFGIVTSQEFGAGNIPGLRKTVAGSVWLSLFISIAFTVVSVAITAPVLRLLGTPDEVLPMGVLYLSIRFGGAVFVMAFNLCASILRALGDGRTPLIAIIISSVVNVVLDIIFVYPLQFGIAGAAAATIIAQFFSVIYCLAVMRRMPELQMTAEDFVRDGRIALDRELSGRLMNTSYPVAIQNTVIGIGGMIVTGVVNGFGVLFIAGYTATNKLYGLLENAAVAYGYAMSTYAGQNYGAGRYRRIRKGTWAGCVIGVITSAAIMAVMIALGKPILSCFLSGSEEEIAVALDYGYRFLVLMSTCLPVLYLLYVIRSTLQGVGETIMPMVSGIAEFVMRVGSAIFLTRMIGETGTFWAEVLAWAGADLILIPSFLNMIRKLPKENE